MAISYRQTAPAFRGATLQQPYETAELERVGQLDLGREWIFDRDFPFETVRYDLLIH